MYIQNNLLPDEEIIYWVRPHWIIFLSPFAILIIGLWLLFYGDHFFNIGLRIMSLEINEILSLFCFILAGIQGLIQLIHYLTSEYAVTSKRILMKTGWISRNVLEIFISKVEAVHVMQSIPGRILGYGTLMVVGTGGTRDPFPCIPDPLRFRRFTQLEVDKVSQERKT